MASRGPQTNDLGSLAVLSSQRRTSSEQRDAAVQSSKTRLVPPLSRSAAWAGLAGVDGGQKAIAAESQSTVAGRSLLRPARRRLVDKAGNCNVVARGMTRRKRAFVVDLFTTMVDLRWRWHVGVLVTVFVTSWLLFAGAWFALAFAHGDVVHTVRNASASSQQSHEACVDNVYDFTSAFLFSIETQSTIGYGYRVVQTDCPVAVVILMLQSCVGLFIQALAAGLIYAKLSRSKSRAQTLLFSERAVICKRDERYRLMFRVADMRRRSHLVSTAVRALLVRNRLTAEGEALPLSHSVLTLETNTASDPADNFVFLVWPMTVTHCIDADSPLWELSLTDLASGAAHFEIIVILEGTVESTGMLAQVRTSYLPDEIGWGERMCPLLTYQRDNSRYEIDYSQFHETVVDAPMPSCSARAWCAHTAAVDGSAAKMGGDFPASFRYSATPGLRRSRVPATGSGAASLLRALRRRRRRVVSSCWSAGLRRSRGLGSLRHSVSTCTARLPRSPLSCQSTSPPAAAGHRLKAGSD